MSANRFSFRAWWPQKKTMYGPFALIGETTMFDLLNQIRIEDLDEPVLMQSTGLSDKDGVEIFEGDVVRTVAINNDHNQKGATQVMCVLHFMGNSCLCFAGHDSGLPLYPFNVSRWIEVIGNIHENPELLEVG